MLSRRELLLLLASSAVADESKDYPILKARVEPLWKSPDGHANALEATDEGLWVGEQITDIAYLLDLENGQGAPKIADRLVQHQWDRLRWWLSVDGGQWTGQPTGKA